MSADEQQIEIRRSQILRSNLRETEDVRKMAPTQGKWKLAPGELVRAVGSAEYMAPEQALGKIATASSDVYSLGLGLFETLTGHLPFEEEDAADVPEQNVRGILPSPRDFNPYVPEEVAEIVMRALQKDPAARYSSARAFGEALEQLRRQSTRRMLVVVSGAAAPAVPTGRIAPRFTRPALALGVLVVAGIAYAGVHAGGTWSRTHSAGSRPALSTPRARTRSPASTVPTSSLGPSATRGILSHPAYRPAALSVRPLAGAASPTVFIAGTRFHSRERRGTGAGPP